MSRTIRIRLLTLFLCASAAAFAYHHSAAEAMQSAATAFLTSLDGEQADIARFDFNAKERTEFHFVPDSNFAQQRGYPIQRSIGRHTNDGMTSFYMHSPSGWLMEYGYGADLVDDEVWESKMYDSPKIWGHTPVSTARAWPKVVSK